MKDHRFLSLALSAVAAILAGCASAPAEPQAAAQAHNPCRGEAPATGTMLRKKEDCSTRTMSQEEIDEFRRTTVITKPLPGRSGAGQ